VKCVATQLFFVVSNQRAAMRSHALAAGCAVAGKERKRKAVIV